MKLMFLGRTSLVSTLLMQHLPLAFIKSGFIIHARCIGFQSRAFNAAHRLSVPEWSDEENAAVFGKCSNPNYHGHNYRLIVKVTGEPDARTGFVIDLKRLSDIIKGEVLQRFDHKNLNLDTREFKDTNPTAENIAIVIYNLLRAKIGTELDLKITLYETERNFVEFPA